MSATKTVPLPPPDALAELCRRRHIRRLSLFGSILRDDFGPDSDVDVLVEFEPGHRPGWKIVEIENDLSRLFGGRDVEVLTPGSLGPLLRDRVLGEAAVIYDRGRSVATVERRRGSPMSRAERDASYLGHMLDAARRAIQRVEGVTFEQFAADDSLQDAVAHRIQIVGEAARRVSAATRSQYPSIPWPEVVGMRHRIVHDYLNVRVDILWDVVRNDLPPLVAHLTANVPQDEP